MSNRQQAITSYKLQYWTTSGSRAHNLIRREVMSGVSDRMGRGEVLPYHGHGTMAMASRAVWAVQAAFGIGPQTGTVLGGLHSRAMRFFKNRKFHLASPVQGLLGKQQTHAHNLQHPLRVQVVPLLAARLHRAYCRSTK